MRNKQDTVEDVIRWMESRYLHFSDNWEAKNLKVEESIERFKWTFGGDVYTLVDLYLSDKGEDEEKELPMGVSQWWEHGKKYGYQEFFAKKLNIRKILRLAGESEAARKGEDENGKKK